MLVYYAARAFSESFHAKVHQQPERAVGQAQVGEELLLVDRRSALCRFNTNGPMS